MHRYSRPRTLARDFAPTHNERGRDSRHRPPDPVTDPANSSRRRGNVPAAGTYTFPLDIRGLESVQFHRVCGVAGTHHERVVEGGEDVRDAEDVLALLGVGQPRLNLDDHRGIRVYLSDDGFLRGL